MDFLQDIFFRCRNNNNTSQVSKSYPSYPKITPGKDSEALVNIAKKVNSVIGQSKIPKSLVIIGETGVGKSSLTYILAGKRLEIRHLDGEISELVLDIYSEEDRLKDIEIGHKKISQTLTPGKVSQLEKDFVIWDCPGFEDLSQDLTYDLINSYSIQRIFEVSEEIKFILIMPEYYIKARGQNSVRVFEYFSSFFEDVHKLKGCLCLLLTHVPIGKPKEMFEKNLLNIIEDYKSLSEKTKLLINYFCENIEIFPELKEPSLLPSNLTSALQAIPFNINYFKNNPCDIKVPISEKTRHLSLEFLALSLENLYELICFLDKKITATCCMRNSLEPIIDKEFFKTQINSSFANEQQHLREIARIDALCSLNKILNECCQLSDEEEGFGKFIEILYDNIFKIIKIISQFKEKNTQNFFFLEQTRNSFKEDAQEVLSRVKYLWGNSQKQKSEYVPKINKKLVLTLKKIENEIEQSIYSIAIYPNESNAYYYEKVIEFLSLYEEIDETNEIKVKISQAFLFQSKSLFSCKIIQKSIMTAINSFVYCSKNIESIEFLNEILKESRNYMKILKNEQQTLAITLLFKINNEKIKNLFKKAREQILLFLSDWEKYDFIEFIEKCREIFERFSALSHSPISNSVTKFIEDLKVCLNLCKIPNEFASKIEDLAIYIRQICDIIPNINNKDIFIEDYEENKSINFTKELNQWINYFDLANNIKLAIYRKTKEILSIKTEFNEEQLLKMIKYSSFTYKIILENNLIIETQNDSDYKNLKKQSYFNLGKIYKDKKQFDEAEDCFIKAFEVDSTYFQVLDSLEEIFFFNYNKLRSKKLELNQKLLGKASNDFITVLKKKVVFFVDDYTTNLYYFNPLKNHWDYLNYLKNLVTINSFLKKFFADKSSYDYENYIELFLQMLLSIEPILEQQVIYEEVYKKKSETFINIERIFHPKGLFALNVLKNQIIYIKSLVFMNLLQEKEVFLGIMNEAIDLLEFKSTHKRIELKVLNMDLSLKENEPEYYLNIISMMNMYFPNEKLCLKTTCQCEMRLGDISKDHGDIKQAVAYYEKAYEEIIAFCNYSEQYNKLEKKKYFNTRKEIIEKLGDLHFSMGNYTKAFSIFKNIDETFKIMKCFKELKNVEKLDFNFLEEKGDYYCDLGFVDKSISAYHQARSFAPDADDVARLFKKIANVLESIPQKAKEFRERAEEIEKTGIIK